MDEYDFPPCRRCGGEIGAGEERKHADGYPQNNFQHTDPFDCIAALRERLDRHRL